MEDRCFIHSLSISGRQCLCRPLLFLYNRGRIVAYITYAKVELTRACFLCKHRIVSQSSRTSSLLSLSIPEFFPNQNKSIYTTTHVRVSRKTIIGKDREREQPVFFFAALCFFSLSLTSRGTELGPRANIVSCISFRYENKAADAERAGGGGGEKKKRSSASLLALAVCQTAPRQYIAQP